MSRKSERLVNLTIALLATKRFITKQEIFAAIEGYEGEIEAMERMFERDKEDLRRLGIDIEVGSFDPLFEDEAGYRIRPENYRLALSELQPIHLALISLATRAWKGAALNSTALSALVKLKSLGMESDLDSLPSISPRIPSGDENLEKIVSAIAEKKEIAFDYLDQNLNAQSRVIHPYGAGTKNGYWYVAGNDIAKNEVRLFRVDRIAGAVKTQGRVGSFLIPHDFSMPTLLASRSRNQQAQLKIRRGKAQSLVSVATITSEDDDWLSVEYPFADQSELIQDVLWHLDDVILVSPESAVKALTSTLDEIVALHG